MWVRPFALRSKRRFGFLLRFALKISEDAVIDDRRKGELSLTHKNGHVNEAFYLDQAEKVSAFIGRFHRSLQNLQLSDGTTITLDRRLTTIPALQLENRMYVFGNGKEARSQFFGLRDFGPYSKIGIFISRRRSRAVAGFVSCSSRRYVFYVPWNGSNVQGSDRQQERSWDRGVFI
jgi:hypothetical protein